MDDFKIFAANRTDADWLVSTLAIRLELKDLGGPRKLLGLESSRCGNNCLSVCQSGYIKSILDDFHLDTARKVKTPLPDTFVPDDSPVPEQEAGFTVKRFQHGIGCVQHLASVTRPGICRALSILTQFNAKPTPKCWLGLLHLITYLKSTHSYSLKFRPSSTTRPLHIRGYSDLDWPARRNTSRKSTSGFIFLVNDAPIPWKSSKQTCITLSSNETGYVALADASREGFWIRSLLLDLNLIGDAPISLHVDKNGALHLVEVDGLTSRSKHIDVRFHFTRELYKTKPSSSSAWFRKTMWPTS